MYDVHAMHIYLMGKGSGKADTAQSYLAIRKTT